MWENEHRDKNNDKSEIEEYGTIIDEDDNCFDGECHGPKKILSRAGSMGERKI